MSARRIARVDGSSCTVQLDPFSISGKVSSTVPSSCCCVSMFCPALKDCQHRQKHPRARLLEQLVRGHRAVQPLVGKGDLPILHRDTEAIQRRGRGELEGAVADVALLESGPGLKIGKAHLQVRREAAGEVCNGAVEVKVLRAAGRVAAEQQDAACQHRQQDQHHNQTFGHKKTGQLLQHKTASCEKMRADGKMSRFCFRFF